MPTYEYKCMKCDHEFELFQNMSDEPVKTCPKCGGSVQRLIGSGAGLIFKGSGFYTTDYRSEKYTKDAKADKAKDKAAVSSKKTTNKVSADK